MPNISFVFSHLCIVSVHHGKVGALRTAGSKRGLQNGCCFSVEGQRDEKKCETKCANVTLDIILDSELTLFCHPSRNNFLK